MRGGTEKIDHPRGAHDDLSVVIAGTLWRMTPPTPHNALVLPWIGTASDVMAETGLSPVSAWSRATGYTDISAGGGGYKLFGCPSGF